MDKSIKIYIGILIFLLVAIIVVDSNKPQKIDWNPTFGLKDKIPFGLYILDAELPKLLKNNKISKVNVSFYEYLNLTQETDSSTFKIKGTFLAIDNYDNIDSESASSLLKFVAQNNNAFLSMNSFPKIILDSLKIDIKSQNNFGDSTWVWMANRRFDANKYNLGSASDSNYFSKLDTLNTAVLGFHNGDSTRVNFIKVKYKSGNFFLHTIPGAFTNYSLLNKNNSAYASNVLSYLPADNVFWAVKDQNGLEVSSAPLRYIFSQTALKTAWFVFLSGMIVFMIFTAKRKQRVVPIIKSPNNTTVDFVKTIGNLYYYEGNHSNLIEKKIVYFLDKIRQKYMLDTTVLDENFIERFHKKSGRELAHIQDVIAHIKTFQKNKNNATEDDLVTLNHAIEKLNL